MTKLNPRALIYLLTQPHFFFFFFFGETSHTYSYRNNILSIYLTNQMLMLEQHLTNQMFE